MVALKWVVKVFGMLCSSVFHVPNLFISCSVWTHRADVGLIANCHQLISHQFQLRGIKLNSRSIVYNYFSVAWTWRRAAGLIEGDSSYCLCFQFIFSGRRRCFVFRSVWVFHMTTFWILTQLLSPRALHNKGGSLKEGGPVHMTLMSRAWHGTFISIDIYVYMYVSMNG